MWFRSLCCYTQVAAVLLPALLYALAVPARAQSDEEMLQDTIDETKRTELERTPLFERSEAWLCIPTKRSFCSSESCDAIGLDDQVYVELKNAGKTYTRCGAGGCSDLDAISQPLGIFTLVTAPNAGAFIKIVNDGGKFVDLATRGFGVWISFGKCRPM